MMTIDHDTERDLTSETGHEHSCWEQFAEETVEDLAEQGIEITGRHDDEIDGQTLWMRYENAIAAGRECDCETE